ncbi:putative phage tail collar domain [Rhodopseudomonas palustris TIE-1]|uniref:phage tail protein n=1 Tax=Rhodopseudomonas palustris TaxID=1076 RepID=UPI000164AA89|nr:tail fiber protein [Rhodopseudomonas palustris]ACF01581.1 putative phage tail collar domain [Rhodopseudomonas palustris TIE-1]
MTLYKWSQTAANNANADGTCPFPEGMSPAAVNDGARGLMAAVAKYRDDLSGMIVTTGTPSAYAVATNQVFDTLAHFHNQVIAFTPHITNSSGPVTMSVDNFTNLPLRMSPGVELPDGTLIQGTPYAAKYNNTDGSLYLLGFMSSPYNVPLFGGLDYWDTVAPNSSFIFPLGQELSRTVYSKAFARWGTKFGVGNGSTTFNAPNKAGRVSAMIEPSPSLLTSVYFGGNSAVIGSIGGAESHALQPTEGPTHTHGITDPGHDHPYGAGQPQNLSTGGSNLGLVSAANGNGAYTSGKGVTGITINNAGEGKPHLNCQPTITCNYIIRVL